MEAREIFRCPACRGGLAAGEGALTCGCGRSWEVRKGIPCFSGHDEFYEGRFAAPVEDGVARRRGLARSLKALRDRLASNTVKHRFTRDFLSRFDPAATMVLDVGCGGGSELLARFRTVGIDLSLEGLAGAGGIYEAVAAADALALPFADDTFDVIHSWDFFGHIPFDAKEAVLAEWKRVLKPGGSMLHIIEAHCTAPFYRLVRRDAELFQRYFIELDGHYGLELPSLIEARFRDAGFRVEKSWTFFRAGIFPPEEYAKRLGPEYARSSATLRAFAAFGNACVRHPRLYQAASLATGALARALNPLLPREWGSTVFLVLGN